MPNPTTPTRRSEVTISSSSSPERLDPKGGGTSAKHTTPTTRRRLRPPQLPDKSPPAIAYTTPLSPPTPLSSLTPIALHNPSTDETAGIRTGTASLSRPTFTTCQKERSTFVRSWNQHLDQTSSPAFDHGWEPPPALICFHSSSQGIFHDIPPPPMDRRSNALGRCLAAARAFECVTNHEDSIRSALMQCRWEGTYSIQVGFNEEMLHLEQGLLQEIHIFLNNDVTPLVTERLTSILYPFPVTFHTPSATRCIPELPPHPDFWELWTRYGIYRASNNSQGLTPPADGDDTLSCEAGGHSFSLAGVSGGDSQNGSNKESDDSDDGSDERGDSSNGGDGGVNGILNDGVRDKSKGRGISIPFSSTLICEGEDIPSSLHPSLLFKTLACVDIKIEENVRSQSRPTQSTWGGPWMEAKMTLLDAEIQEGGSTGQLGYSLGLSQLRIIASSCPSSILHFTPSNICAGEDNFIAKTEKTRKGGIQATLGANPSVRLEGTFGRSVGEEKVQKRWEISPHCLGSDRNDITGNPQTTMMWKYVHNDEYYQRKAGHVFDPKPSAIFGLSRAASTMPLVEVEIVMHYSRSTPPSHKFRDWLAGLSLTNKQPPVFLNFLHQVSVVVDLGTLEQDSWVVGLGSNDRQAPDNLGLPFPPIIERVETDNMRPSQCNVTLGRALYGRVDLAEEERQDAHPLICNAILSTPPGDFHMSWPSPSPPSPSTSSTPPRRGAAEFITKIPAGYVVNGRRFPDRSTAMRMAELFMNKTNHSSVNLKDDSKDSRSRTRPVTSTRPRRKIVYRREAHTNENIEMENKND